MKEFYPNMIHITCAANSIHRICETLHDSFSNVTVYSAAPIIFS